MKLTHLIPAALLLSTAAAFAADPDRVISADLKAPKGPRAMSWQDCVGAGRVGEGLRDGWRRQLELCKKEIGFNYIRMHGLLTDELAVYSEDKQGNPKYNFQYIDDVYDFLLDTGIRPFVEISFTPNALASGTKTIFTWKGNVTPPKDYAKWDALITALVQHWTDRYGTDEVKKWRFEIWNEPQLADFFAPPQGVSSRDAYMELYEHTAKAVRAVNNAYIVGGPSGAGPSWNAALVQYCNQKNLPLDFISFHAYGLGGGPSGLDLYGNRLLYLANDLQTPAKTANQELTNLQNMGKANLPIDITEWSASYSSRDPIHDSYFSAPYILEQLRNTEKIRSMSYWTFTDVFEESGIPPQPFHGGFGMINYQGICKPSFWAYSFLAKLGPTELKNADASSFVCTDDKGNVQVLLWDLTHPTSGSVSDHEFFWKAHPAKEKGSATVKLANLPAGQYKLATYSIGYHLNDPFSKYIEMDKPANLTRQQIADMKKLSAGTPVSETTVTVDGAYTTTLPMLENSVYFLTFTPQK